MAGTRVSPSDDPGQSISARGRKKARPRALTPPNSPAPDQDGPLHLSDEFYDAFAQIICDIAERLAR